ncbi:DUF1223 domain-containing protein [Cognatishimia sp.]|uniref:DUF1223 domain-containing protein n=1 Tax=Cognatishimia sp. TaxID=2211648 RepID=UPI0035114645
MARFSRWIQAALLSVGLGVSAGAVQAGGPVVVELYTSQGCSSCPPADAFLAKELAKRDDVIALALHVDYWDYIGWKDDFADPAYTDRQRGYARAAGQRTIYTPQMIIGGLDHVIGSHPREVKQFIGKHAEAANDVAVSLTRTGDVLEISLDPGTVKRSRMSVQLVRYMPRATRDIKRGENAGRELHYANIVTEWLRVGTWNMRSDKTFKANVEGDQPIVVLVQREGHGQIVAAARLN